MNQIWHSTLWGHRHPIYILLLSPSPNFNLFCSMASCFWVARQIPNFNRFCSTDKCFGVTGQSETSTPDNTEHYKQQSGPTYWYVMQPFHAPTTTHRPTSGPESKISVRFALFPSAQPLCCFLFIPWIFFPPNPWCGSTCQWDLQSKHPPLATFYWNI